MQVEKEHPDIAADTLMTEANLSDMVKDGSEGEAEHEKVEDVSGIVENVIDDMDTDVKASESLMDTSLGESEHEKQELSRSDALGGIEKVTSDEEKSTVETTSGGIKKVTDSEEKSMVETTVLPAVLVIYTFFLSFSLAHKWFCVIIYLALCFIFILFYCFLLLMNCAERT